MVTVLIAEDDEAIRDMVARFLRSMYHVISAPDGLKCLEMVHEHKPQLILMDIQMPHLDGLETTRRLKANPETQAIPIIALTAYAFPEDRQRAMLAGCNDYETKPVDFTQLLDKINLWLTYKNSSPA